MNTPEILDLARLRAGLPSDRKLAQAMGITTGRISLFRTGARKLDGANCIKIAELIGCPPAYILALVAAERAEDERVAAEWRRAAKLLKRSAAGVALALALFVSPDANSAQGSARAASDLDIHYARYRRRGLRPAGLRPAVPTLWLPGASCIELSPRRRRRRTSVTLSLPLELEPGSPTQHLATRDRRHSDAPRAADISLFH